MYEIQAKLYQQSIIFFYFQTCQQKLAFLSGLGSWRAYGEKDVVCKLNTIPLPITESMALILSKNNENYKAINYK